MKIEPGNWYINKNRTRIVQIKINCFDEFVDDSGQKYTQYGNAIGSPFWFDLEEIDLKDLVTTCRNTDGFPFGAGRLEGCHW